MRLRRAGARRALRLRYCRRNQTAWHRSLYRTPYWGMRKDRCDDVGGIAVHIGARVAALAGAGEVLVSSTVKDLVAGSGLRFGDRSRQSPKGVPGEWRIFAVER
jgi:hypothetical protein